MKDRRIEITGILLIAVSIFILISLIGYNSNEVPEISSQVRIENPMGILGVYIAHFLIKMTLGYFSFLLPILGIFWGWWLFSKKKLAKLRKTTLFILIGMLLASISLGIISLAFSKDYSQSYLTAGLVGNVVARFFVDFLGKIGAGIIAIAGWLILIRTYFSLSYYDTFNKTVGKPMGRWQKKQKVQREKKKHTKQLRAKIEEKRRIEVVRILPQFPDRQDTAELIQDPWRSFDCEPGTEFCEVEFEDREFGSMGREVVYYVRAVQQATATVNGDPFRCDYDAEGNCIKTNYCLGVAEEDDCLSDAAHRAWSSPIFVSYSPGASDQVFSAR